MGPFWWAQAHMRYILDQAVDLVVCGLSTAYHCVQTVPRDTAALSKSRLCLPNKQWGEG